MSGVGISGLIANLPTTITPYPTQDPNLEKGGFRNDVATIADRNLIPANFRTEGMQVYVRATKCIYALLPDLTTFKIIGNVNLGAQAAWFINPDNSTGLASDNNDGLTALTPLLTWAEYANRCFPSGARLLLKQSVTVTVLAATAQTINNMFMNYGQDPANAAGVVIVTVIGALTSSAPITLTGVVAMNAATGVRAQLTTGAGTFVNGEKIRVTSGPAIGACCYSMGLAGGPLSTYIGLPGVDEFTYGTFPSIGNTVVVDTLLLQANRLEVWAGALVRVRISDFKVTRALLYCGDLASFTGSGSGITLINCVATSAGGQWQAFNGAQFFNCQVAPTSKTSFIGNQVLLVNQNVRGVLGFGQGSFNVYGLWVNAGNVIVGVTDNYNHPGMGANAKVYMSAPVILAQSAGAMEAENGPGAMGASQAAFTICPGSLVQSDSFQSEMWGVSGGYPLGFNITALAWLFFSGDPFQDSPLVFMKIAATVGMRICGKDFAYSANPIEYRTLAGGIVVQPQPNSAMTENYVNRTGLTAALGVTALMGAGAARKGTYRVWGYLAPTVAGAAGTLTLNAVYTDEAGATITQPICSINNTVLSGAGGSIEAECNGATAVSYSVTGFSAGLTYSVRVAAEYDSNGP